MPGRQMGPRPPDFDEELVRRSPTFIKWSRLSNNEILRYACREFVKGQPTEEERLMRRIMIARRNNLRDHETLKRARKREERSKTTTIRSSDNNNNTAGAASIATTTATAPAGAGVDDNNDKIDPSTHRTTPNASATITANSRRKRRRHPVSSFSEVAKEMDVPAVEATRSYRAWTELEDGAEFVYNQTYTKGRDGHDWLLRKNIWRRMRYRRANKKMVERGGGKRHRSLAEPAAAKQRTTNNRA